MNQKHHSLYKHLIEWEQKEKLALKGDSVLLGDSLIIHIVSRKTIISWRATE